MATVEGVRIIRDIDENPDLSYIEGMILLSRSRRPKASERYWLPRLDRERRESYGQSWEMLGVRAEASICIPMGDTSIMHRVTSPGLWGIESDSDESYIEQIESAELDILADMLTDLGIPSSVETLRAKIVA